MKAYPRSLQDNYWQCNVGWWRRELSFMGHENKHIFRDHMNKFQEWIKSIRESRCGLFDGVWMKPEAHLAVARRITHRQLNLLF
jgi:hypothetical protein